MLRLIILGFLITLTACSSSPILQECRIYDEAGDTWDIGYGHLCNSSRDCVDPLYSSDKVSCMPTEYVEMQDADCLAADGLRAYLQLPKTAVFCNTTGVYATRGVANFLDTPT